MTTPNSPYLQAIDDHLPMRETTGSWPQEKLYYISRYIDMFTTSMRNKGWSNIRFIDLFAGPGKCSFQDTQQIALGSPLLALTTRYPFTKYIFVDKNADHIATLQKRCSSLHDVDIQYVCGDSNIVVDALTQQIRQEERVRTPGKWSSSLNLAVLDPEGLELQWQTVEKLASINKMDLIIHYSQFGLTRNFDNYVASPDENFIDRFFGDRHWREIYTQQMMRNASKGTIHRLLIDHYKEKLTRLGYQDVTQYDNLWDEPVIKTPKTNAPMYRLLFASKSELGHKFWQEVTKIDPYQGRRLL